MMPLSPELKKKEWSVYALDQSVSDTKFSVNGTINTVLNDDEAVAIVGKVKRRFRRELLDVEFLLIQVHSSGPTVTNRSPSLLPNNNLHYLLNNYYRTRFNNGPLSQHPHHQFSHNHLLQHYQLNVS